MRVLVTGATGFVGAHTIPALIAAGHTPRVLARDPRRVEVTIAALGVDVDALEVVPGDMTDEDAVKSAAEGTDAAIHAAAVVAALDRASAARAVDTNVRGARIVLDTAIAAGCDPVVHISSVAAVFDPGASTITTELPPAIHADSPYTRSKALAEQIARDRQAVGAPITIVYPGGVCGPPAGPLFGDVAEGFVSMLRSGVVPLRDGGVGLIDARDLAAVLTATITPGLGPRRFMAGGRLLDMHDVGRLLCSVTGRNIRVVPTPGAVFRGVGRAMDLVRKAVPIQTLYTAEAMDLLTRAKPTDDSAVQDVLGVSYRPPTETATELISGLYRAGRLNARQAGNAAQPGASAPT
jgi:dihydroflavonol-4-reductase